MAKLRKEEVDAVLAEHARGYTVMEIAERTGLHRNTVAKVLRPVEAPVSEPSQAEKEREQLLAALERTVDLLECSKCGALVPMLVTRPNLFWRGLVCGYVVRCKCGRRHAESLPGYDARFAQAAAAMDEAEKNWQATRKSTAATNPRS